MLLFFCVSLLPQARRCCAGGNRQLNVALHAQAAPSEGLIVGSVMTTSGLQRALLRTGEVRTARTFYPFHYDGLGDEFWDLLIIEGWFETMFAVIHEVRRQSPGVKVLYWCLDPDFPGLSAILSIDVDGYLTNSERTLETLARVAPSQLLNLAFDPEEMGGDATRGERLVYVGSALGLSTKRNLLEMLLEAAESSAGLDLWGTGWNTVGPKELLGSWRGVLPHGELGNTYRAALAVLGATMDGQRDQGMINNRVFEALGVGAPLIQESFDDNDVLYQVDNLFLYRSKGDIQAAVDILTNRTQGEWKSAETNTIQTMTKYHTYDDRAKTLLDFVSELSNQPATKCDRAGCLRMALVYDSHQPQLFATFGPVAEILSAHYAITWIPITRHDNLLAYDIVLAVGRLDGLADHRVRRLTADFTLPRRLEQRRILVLLDDGDEASSQYSDDKSAGSVYDAVCLAGEIGDVEDIFREFSIEPGCYSTFGSVSNEHQANSSQVVVAADVGLAPSHVAEAARGNEDVVVAVLADRISTSWLKELKEQVVDSDIRLISDATEFVRLTATSRKFVIPHPASYGIPPRGQWALAAGLRHASSVEVFYADNARLMKGYPPSSFDDYAARIQFAVTRAFCLGRAAASMDLRVPSVIHKKTFPVKLDLQSFEIGRDGSWCLVSAKDDETIACVLQRDVTLLLSLDFPEEEDCRHLEQVSFYAQLKSNLYSDVLLRSETVTVQLRLSGDQETGSPKTSSPQVLPWKWRISSCLD